MSGTGYEPAISDQEILRRMKADELDAFEAFFERYRTPIFRTACALTGDPSAAEEVLQDTFVRAYHRRSMLRPDVSPLPWLHRVALNLCYTRLARRPTPSQPISDESAQTLRDDSVGPARHAEQTELQSILRDGIATLPLKHQGVVVLYYLHGLSLQETAQALDLRLGTVKSRLHYALRTLRLRLQEDDRFAGASDVPASPRAGEEPA